MSLDSGAFYYKIGYADYLFSGPVMSSINSLVHHIDQLLTQHRDLQRSHAQLQDQVAGLEHQLTAQQTAPAQADLNQAVEDDLNHLIGLFDHTSEP